MEELKTPSGAIQAFCRECCGRGSDVADCGGDKCRNGGCNADGVCYFYPYRLGEKMGTVTVIRKTCLWCMNGSPGLVANCGDGGCPLHPYRMGGLTYV